MTVQTWPSYIAPNSIDWWIDTPTRSGGQSLLGSERIVAAPAARWRASMTFRIWGTQTDPKRMLFWRAFAAQMGGRAGSVMIGPFDQITPALLAPVTFIDLPFADTVVFADGSSFSQTSSGTGAIVTTAAASAGAQSIVVSAATAGVPQAGQYFGLGGVEMHIITAVSLAGSLTYTLTFSPPLRNAWSSGSVLDFETPRCTMRLQADDTARQKITIGGVADVTLDLIETF